MLGFYSIQYLYSCLAIEKYDLNVFYIESAKNLAYNEKKKACLTGFIPGNLLSPEMKYHTGLYFPHFPEALGLMKMRLKAQVEP